MNLKKTILSILLTAPTLYTHAQNARLQVIHNCADAAADSVDVYLNGTKILDNFAFRTATSYLPVSSGVALNIGVAPKTSLSVADTIYNLNATLAANTHYVAVANGIVSASGYAPGRSAAPFRLSVFPTARATSAVAGNTDVLVVHGATDAPTVDVRSGVNTLVNDIAFGQFSNSYLQLPLADYKIRVTTSTGATTVQTYSAPLQTLGLGGRAITVVASGFLNPSVNSNRPGFGLFAADTVAGPLLPLPVTTPEAFARAQVIHNCADGIADSVDVYLNGAKILDNFAFRTATPFLDLPSGRNLLIGVAAKNSTSVADTIYNLTALLDSAKRYILVANGIVSKGGYSPTSSVAPFRLSVFGAAREAAATNGQTDVLVLHGATDAPTVDIASGGSVLVDNIRFGQFAANGYLGLPTNNYTIDVRDSANTTTVASYVAPLQTLNLQNASLAVLASGFLNPSVNSNRPGFGLWAALPTGGALIALPPATAGVFNASRAKEITVYPNPVRNQLYLPASVSEKALVSVLDATGRVVAREAAAAGVLDVSRLTPGIYMLQVNSERVSGTARFVKE